MPEQIRVRRPPGARGFTLLETIIGVAFIGAAAVAYYAYDANLNKAVKQVVIQQDYSNLRRFIVENFDCDETMREKWGHLRKEGNYKAPKVTGNECPSPAVARHLKGGELIGPTMTKLGYMSVTTACEQTAIDRQNGYVKFKFFARPLTKSGALAKHPVTGASIERHDVFQGMYLRCERPEPPPPPIAKTCSVGLYQTSNSSTVGTMAGDAFRNNSWKGGEYYLLLKSTYDPNKPEANSKPVKWSVTMTNRGSHYGHTETAAAFTITPPAATLVDENLSVCKSSSSSDPNDDAVCKNWEQKMSFGSSQITTPDNWFSTTIESHVVGYAADDSKLTECTFGFNIYDPLLFTWRSPKEPPGDLPRTLALFDLAGEGRLRRVAWIGGSDVAYLALDRNGNGQIDSGAELFGDATPLPEGKRARDGFAALRTHDSNEDGVVDPDDRDFSRLLLWFDENLNAQSEPWELKTLAELSITRVELRHEVVRNRPNKRDFNLDFIYEGRFYDDGFCKKDGCRIYDATFGALDTPAMTARMAPDPMVPP